MVFTPEPDRPAEAGGPPGGDERRDFERDAPRPSTIVRYGAMGWVGEFTFRRDALRPWGLPVVVETDRGIELGYQLDLCHAQHPLCVAAEIRRQYVATAGPDFCRANAGRVLREATPQDVDEHRRLNAHVQEDIDQCAEVADELKLDMKIVTAEHLLGGERIVFYFRSEGRIDFRDLVKELARRYRTRIEMRQVGARDEARLVADWEVCGRECCCKNFLKTLRPVNMKMAKLQKSTLDPAKVSGRCGRLRCCLRYENQGYQELQARLPRRGSRVRAAAGEGTVVEHHVLTQLVTIRTDDQKDIVVPCEELLATDLPRPRPPEPGPEAPSREPEGAPGQERPVLLGRRPRRAEARPAPAESGPREVAEPPRGPDAGQPGASAGVGGPPGDGPLLNRSRGRRRRRSRGRRPGQPPAAPES